MLDDFYVALQRPDIYTRVASGICGWHWEDELKVLCEPYGFSWDKPEKVERHDCRINGQKIQCKFTTDPLKADLRHHAYKGPRRYTPRDIDIMAVKVKEKCRPTKIMLIPVPEIMDPKKPGYTRGTIRIKEYERHLDNWNVFRGLACGVLA